MANSVTQPLGVEEHLQLKLNKSSLILKNNQSVNPKYFYWWALDESLGGNCGPQSSVLESLGLHINGSIHSKAVLMFDWPLKTYDEIE